jgi:hypothetical protein
MRDVRRCARAEKKERDRREGERCLGALEFVDGCRRALRTPTMKCVGLAMYLVREKKGEGGGGRGLFIADSAWGRG